MARTSQWLSQTTPKGDSNAHVILITGWNENLDAWEIKNSWGPTWGQNGFAYVKKGIRDIGDNAMWIVAAK